jgi:hypothetical protein
MPESEEQRQQRVLKELEGKNVAHYSVMLAAYISAVVDPNKAIFTLSSAGVGLLVALVDRLTNLTSFSKFLYCASLIFFSLTIISTLFVLGSNAKAIEGYIRDDSRVGSKLKTWKYINYVLFAVSLTLMITLAIVLVNVK